MLDKALALPLTEGYSFLKTASCKITKFAFREDLSNSDIAFGSFKARSSPGHHPTKLVLTFENRLDRYTVTFSKISIYSVFRKSHLQPAEFSFKSPPPTIEHHSYRKKDD
jgi:hypothetical protein